MQGASNSVLGDPNEDSLCFVSLVGLQTGVSMMQKVIFGHNCQNLFSVWSFGAIDYSGSIKLLKW